MDKNKTNRNVFLTTPAKTFFITSRILSNLAIWEPRTFRSIIGIAAEKSMQSEQTGGLGMQKCGPPIEIIHGGKI